MTDTDTYLYLYCSAFYAYDDCMQPIKGMCPQGVDAVYETENEWHRIVKIAAYLCRDGLQGVLTARLYFSGKHRPQLGNLNFMQTTHHYKAHNY